MFAGPTDTEESSSVRHTSGVNQPRQQPSRGSIDMEKPSSIRNTSRAEQPHHQPSRGPIDMGEPSSISHTSGMNQPRQPPTRSFWNNFLSTAGLSPADCSQYTELFIKHKMNKQALPLLNKEYLYDMGITAIGDVITILSHAKEARSSTFH